MSNKHARVTVFILMVAVAVLAVGVAHKMNKTSVSAQTIDLPRVTATQLSDSQSAAAPLAVFIGDFTQGPDESRGGENSFANVLSGDMQKAIPLRILVDYSVGGSGYVVRGPSPTIAEQVRRLVTPEAKVVVISGSRNDVVAPPSEVNAAALETYHLVQTQAPQANLIVIGPTWGSDEPSEQILQTRDAVRAAAAAASNAYFVDPIEDKWFTSGEPGLIASGNVEPTDLGQSRIAEYLYPIFAQAVTGKFE